MLLRQNANREGKNPYRKVQSYEQQNARQSHQENGPQRRARHPLEKRKEYVEGDDRAHEPPGRIESKAAVVHVKSRQLKEKLDPLMTVEDLIEPPAEKHPRDWDKYGEDTPIPDINLGQPNSIEVQWIELA